MCELGVGGTAGTSVSGLLCAASPRGLSVGVCATPGLVALEVAGVRRRAPLSVRGWCVFWG